MSEANIKRIKYLASYIIPTTIISVFLFLKDLIPFGSYCTFPTIDAEQALPVFYRFASQLHTGSFSFLNPSGAYNMSMGDAFFLYLSSPFTLLAAIFPPQSAISALSILSFLRLGLAGSCMCFYLENKFPTHSNKYLTPLVSSAYSLSSYFIVQQFDYRYIDCAFLFPILFYCYEIMIHKERKTPYYIVATILLIDNAPIALVTLTILFIHLIIVDKPTAPVHSSLRFLFVTSLSAASSLWSVVPTIQSIHKYALSTKAQPDFSVSLDWLSFFSRFITNSNASLFFTLSNGLNLFFTLFLFLIFILSFFRTDLSIGFRMRKLFFFLTLILFMNVLPFRYLISFCSFGGEIFCPFTFIFVFCAISFSYETFDYLPDIPKLAYYTILPITFVIFLLAGLLATKSLNTAELLITIALFALYIILFILYRIKSIKKESFLFISFVLMIGELFLNTEHQLYNLALDKTPISDYLTFVEQRSDFKCNPFSGYDLDFQDTHDFKPNLLNDTYIIPGNYSLPDRQPTNFETANALYRSLGGEGLLFEISNERIKAEAPSDVYIRQSQNNIIILDGRDYDGDYYDLSLKFEPTRSGQLYLSYPEISYLGESDGKEPLSEEVSFPAFKNHTNMLYIQTAYYNKEGYTELLESLNSSRPEIRHSLFSWTIPLSLSEDSSLVLPLSFSKTANIFVDYKEAKGEKAPASQTVVHVSSDSRIVSVHYPLLSFLTSIIISLSCILFALLYHKRKLPSIKKVISFIFNLSDNLTHLLRRNSVAILSFIIPCMILCLCSCIASFAPFGSGIYYKSDGAAYSVPVLYATRDSMQSNPLSFSILSLFGHFTNLYNNGWLHLFPTGSLIIPATILSIIEISLCGLTLYLYLTRRLYGYCFYKNDPHILIFTTAFSLCSYNLSLRQFINWPFVVSILPLLLLSMDYLLYKKKGCLYAFLLSYCIVINTMNSIYLCIFLALWFFTHHYEDFRDFIFKGLRFAFYSILAAGMSFWVLTSNVVSRSTSGYTSPDSVIPNPFHFYQSYIDSLKQSFVLAESICVTDYDGAINLYCGVFIIFLLFIILMNAARKKRILSRLLIALFILFSSNNELLSFVWNGFHYQSKVPNRYSFLLIFLVIDLAVDGYIMLNRISYRQVIKTIVAFITFGAIIFTFSKGNNIAQIVITILLTTIYSTFFILLPSLQTAARQMITTLILCITLIELSVNCCYTFKSEDINDGSYIEQNVDVSNFLKDNWLKDPSSVRITYDSSEPINQNMTNHVNSLSQFASNTSEYHLSYASSLGYHAYINNIMTSTNETPFASAVSNNAYFIVNPLLFNAFLDTDHYDVLAQYNDSIILKNNYLLSDAFYIPSDFPEKIASLRNAADLANAFCKEFSPGNTMFQEIGQFVSSEAATEASDFTYSISDVSSSLTPYLCHIKIHTAEEGEYYYRNGEFYYLGNLDADTEYEFNIPARSNDAGILYRYDHHAFIDFYKKASTHLMTVTNRNSTFWDGTISLPDEGYILFSLPFNPAYTATVNGIPVECEHLINGALIVKGTAGENKVHIDFSGNTTNSPTYVTIVIWLLYLIILFFESFILSRKTKNTGT